MLMANAQGQPVGLLSFYCKWKKGEPELHKATFKPCSAETADSLLTGLADAYILLHQQPVAWLADVALVVGKGQGGGEDLGQVLGPGLGGDARWVSVAYERQS